MAIAKTLTRPRTAPASPSVGFVSLGCPKALVDSEQILTRLRAEGYSIAPTYQGADLVVVNTCGFIDAAVEESLSAVGEALAENGKVIVTGCLGAKEGGAFVGRLIPRCSRSRDRTPRARSWMLSTRTCRGRTTPSPICFLRRESSSRRATTPI